MTGALLLMVGGLWVITQVLKGDALGRLKLKVAT